MLDAQIPADYPLFVILCWTTGGVFWLFYHVPTIQAGNAIVNLFIDNRYKMGIIVAINKHFKGGKQMGRISVHVTNLTLEQAAWLTKESARTGQTKAAMIKRMVQQEMDKKQVQTSNETALAGSIR